MESHGNTSIKCCTSFVNLGNPEGWGWEACSAPACPQPRTRCPTRCHRKSGYRPNPHRPASSFSRPHFVILAKARIHALPPRLRNVDRYTSIHVHMEPHQPRRRLALRRGPESRRRQGWHPWDPNTPIDWPPISIPWCAGASRSSRHSGEGRNPEGWVRGM